MINGDDYYSLRLQGIIDAIGESPHNQSPESASRDTADLRVEKKLVDHAFEFRCKSCGQGVRNTPIPENNVAVFAIGKFAEYYVQRSFRASART